MNKGRSNICWIDGEQFAVLCYSKCGALVDVRYFDYLFDAQTFCSTCKVVCKYDELEIIRVRLTNVTEHDL